MPRFENITVGLFKNAELLQKTIRGWHYNRRSFIQILLKYAVGISVLNNSNLEIAAHLWRSRDEEQQAEPLSAEVEGIEMQKAVELRNEKDTSFEAEIVAFFDEVV